jgi:hypothetical protein
MVEKKKHSREVRERAARIEVKGVAAGLADIEALLTGIQNRSYVEKERRSVERAERLFGTLANFLDLLLEPDAAENAIGNLAELYLRRLATNPRHAKRWLFAQVLWIIYGRAMDVFGRFVKARAGK